MNFKYVTSGKIQAGDEINSKSNLIGTDRKTLLAQPSEGGGWLPVNEGDYCIGHTVKEWDMLVRRPIHHATPTT